METITIIVSASSLISLVTLILAAKKNNLEALTAAETEKVLLNTNFRYSANKGIAGDAIQSIAALELGLLEE